MDQFRIVFHDEQGHPVSPDELSNMNGRVAYQIVSDREPDPRARELHEQGRAAGQSGDHDRAIEFFTQAFERDPEWAYPLYDLAFTHLLEGEAKKAEQHYRQVDRLAPRGFFLTKLAVDSLRREREGIISSGVYLAFVMLEWEPDAETKHATLMAILEDSPAFPAGWNLLASMMQNAEDRLSAIEQGLSHSPDANTRGNLLIQRAMIMNQQGRGEEAATTLRRVLSDSQCTFDNEAIARIVLSQIEK